MKQTRYSLRKWQFITAVHGADRRAAARSKDAWPLTSAGDTCHRDSFWGDTDQGSPANVGVGCNAGAVVLELLEDLCVAGDQLCMLPGHGEPAPTLAPVVVYFHGHAEAGSLVVKSLQEAEHKSQGSHGDRPAHVSADP